MVAPSPAPPSPQLSRFHLALDRMYRRGDGFPVGVDARPWRPAAGGGDAPPRGVRFHSGAGGNKRAAAVPQKSENTALTDSPGSRNGKGAAQLFHPGLSLVHPSRSTTVTTWEISAKGHSGTTAWRKRPDAAENPCVFKQIFLRHSKPRRRAWQAHTPQGGPQPKKHGCCETV